MRRGAAEPPKPIELRRLPLSEEAIPARVIGVLWDGLRLLLTDPRGLRTVVQGVLRPLVPRRTSGLGSALKRLRLLLALGRMRPDVVHLQWESAAVSHLPLFEVWGCPVIVSCLGSGTAVFPHTGAYDHWTRGFEAVFARATAIHCVSEETKGKVAGLGGDPAKMCVIRPAVDTRFFAPSSRSLTPGAELLAVAAGDLIWLKGFDYLLQAIACLGELGVPIRLEILGGEPALDAGHASDRARLLYTIRALALGSRVALRGRVDHRELRERLQRADVFLHASLSEGIPNVVLEAMACAVPVVVTDAGGTREAVTDGVEGYVVPRRDPRAIATAVQVLSEDPGLRERMGRAGRERVEAEFALDRQVERFVDLYRRLVQE